MISTVGVGSTVLQTCVNQTAKNGGKKGASNKTLPIDTTALRLCPIGPLDSLTASLHFKVPTQCSHFPLPPPARGERKRDETENTTASHSPSAT